MTSPAEAFVVALARTSRAAKRQLRGLSESDKDDVISIALLWCWEHKDEYSAQNMSLDAWFKGAMRNAKRKFLKTEEREARVSLLPMHGAQPEHQVASQQALAQLQAKLSPRERKIAAMIGEGYTRGEIRDKLGGIKDERFQTIKARLRQLRGSFATHSAPPLHGADGATVTRSAGESEERSTAHTGIDRAIEQLDFPPHEGADCPPCWRCKWFEGYLPGGYKPVRMKIVEPEVRDSVLETEARKIDIAQRVRAGTIFAKPWRFT